MKLKSVLVENYRRHRKVQVAFDGNPTLITGANETGKSTLVEAIHRGLFFRSKATGQILDRMRSDAGGVPQVEIVFETGQGQFVLRKQFNGTRGTTLLEQSGGAKWRDDSAEQRLAELLGVEGPIGGGGASAQLERRWAHLWVWQGRSGSEPTGDLEEAGEALLARLQIAGGAGAVQSSLDRLVHDTLKAQVASLFRGTSGQPKANTRWAQLREERERLMEEEARLRTEVAALEEAMTKKLAADRTLAEIGPSLVEAEAARDATRQKRDEITRLREELAPVQAQIASAEAEEKRLAKQAVDLAEAEAVLPVRQRDLEMRKTEEAEARGALKVLDQQVTAAEEALARARVVAESVRRRRDLALAEASARAARAELSRLDQMQKDFAKVSENIRKLQEQVNTLPKLTPTVLARLDGLRDEVLRTKAAVDAVAVGVQVLQAPANLTLGGNVADRQEEVRFSNAFDIEIPGTLHLRVTPGGGTSLEEAVAAHAEAEAGLKAALEKEGVTSLAEARDKAVRRQVLEQELRAEETRLKAAGADTIEEDLAAAAHRLQKAEARVETLRIEAGESGEGPADDDTVQAAEAVVTRLEREQAGIRDRRQEAADRVARAAEALREASDTLRDATTRRDTLIATAGSAQVLAVRKADLAARMESLRQRAEMGQAELAAKGADLIEMEMEMRDKAVASLRKSVETARLHQAEAKAVLDRDGSRDPVSELDVTQTRRASLEVAEAAETARVQALQRLLDLFNEVEGTLEKQFTAPLIARVAAYLAPVFGSAAKVEATYRDGQFGGLILDRPAGNGGRFSFEQLSGGAREQLSVAFRLAVAEILAESHDGCLPVALDDAFVNSDPERFRALHLMLHRAAGRGLQIILTTCAPANYLGLGATTVRLG